MRPPRPAHHQTRLRPLVSAVLVLALGALLLGQAPAGPGASGGGTVAAASAAQTRSAEARGVGARVELTRRRGWVEGDGRTLFVANRTAFRPRRGRVELPPRVRARAWVVVDLDTGRLLGKHRPRAHLPQASTIKLLTAVTATRTIPERARHRVTRFEKSQVCTCSGLRRGRMYRRDALVTAMLLPSANDAAEAVAGAHPQGRWAFYDAMNAVATEIGAVDTVARNASGLSAAGSHSSARDLVLLLRAALADETVAAILARRSARVATVTGRFGYRTWRSTDYVNEYPGSLGKSGWTTPAQNTLVVVTEIDGHRIAVATLGAPTGHSTSGARALTEWGAAHVDGLRAVGRLPRPPA